MEIQLPSYGTVFGLNIRYYLKSCIRVFGFWYTMHTVQGKSWDHFCTSAEGAVSDSGFPSMIAHCGAIGMGRRC